MTKRDWFRPGVFMDVHVQAKLQSRYATSEREVKKEIQSAGFSKGLIKSNVGRLRKLLLGLKWKRVSSEWSHYASNNSYSSEDSRVKEEFVRKVVRQKRYKNVWDLGCNTGTFSRIAAENSDYVIAIRENVPVL